MAIPLFSGLDSKYFGKRRGELAPRVSGN